MNELDLSSALTCDAVQEGLSLLRTGGAGLTDWALLERHVRQCESCRTREQLERAAVAAPLPLVARSARHWLEKLQGERQLRMASFVTWAGPQLAIARGRSGQAAASLIQASLAAGTRLLEALERLGALVSTVGPLVVRLVAGLIRAGALAAAGLTDMLGRLGQGSRRAGQHAARIVMTGAEAVVALVPRGLDRLTRVASLVLRAVGSGLAALSRGGHRAGLATTAAGASMVPHVLALGGAVRRGLAGATMTLGHAGGVLVAAGRAGIALGGAAVGQSSRLIGVATDHAAINVTGVGRAAGGQARALTASIGSVVAYAARPPILTAGTAVVGLVILVAATPLWWPRAWHVDRVARLAAPGNASMSPPTAVQVAQAPIDRKSAEPPVRARLIRTARSVPSPERIGPADGAARRDQSLARTDSPSRPAGSTALSAAGTSRETPRRQEPASSPRIAAEAPDDASAAVDWLLDNTRARRQVESP